MDLRTSVDCAHIFKDFLCANFPHAKKFVLAQDNHNAFASASTDASPTGTLRP
jgi:hypothetical protein